MRRTIERGYRDARSSGTRCHASNDTEKTVRRLQHCRSMWKANACTRCDSRPHERTIDDLEIIYDELLHVKALSHLSSLVKRELASVLIFEAHPFKNEIRKAYIDLHRILL